MTTEWTLASEQEEYISEAIEWTDIGYVANAHIVGLIERGSYGILSILDEICSASNSLTVDTAASDVVYTILPTGYAVVPSTITGPDVSSSDTDCTQTYVLEAEIPGMPGSWVSYTSTAWITNYSTPGTPPISFDVSTSDLSLID